MFCPNCGTQIPDGSAFCPNCGAQLNVQSAVAQQPPAQQSVYQQSAATQQSAAAQQAAPAKKKLSKGKLALIAAAAVFVLALLGIVVNYLSGIGYRKTADTNTPDAAALGLRVEPQKIYDKGGTVIYALGALGVYDFLGDERYEFDVDVENHSFFEKDFIARNVQVNGVAIPPEDEIFVANVHGKASETYLTGDGLMLSVAGLARLNIAKIETITFQIEEHTYFFNNELGTAKLTEPMTIRVS